MSRTIEATAELLVQLNWIWNWRLREVAKGKTQKWNRFDTYRCETHHWRDLEQQQLQRTRLGEQPEREHVYKVENDCQMTRFIHTGINVWEAKQYIIEK
jgi:hypothetical protein